MFSALRKWMPLGKVAEISREDLYKLVSRGTEEIQVLDVRSSKEWRAGHISNSTNIPITKLGGKLGQLDFDKSKLVVAICLSAHRSIPAVRLLNEKGYENVKQLSGGMRAWNKLYRDELEKHK